MGQAVKATIDDSQWRWGVPVCTYCSRKGHLAADCPIARKEREHRDKLKCTASNNPDSPIPQSEGAFGNK